MAGKPISHGRIGPHSRTFNRGAIGHSVDGRSREGRFMRAFEAKLVEHVGGTPSITQRLMISRLARIALRLELFDEKMTDGSALTDQDGKIYGALHNAFRLMLRELGVTGAAQRPPSIVEIRARRQAGA